MDRELERRPKMKLLLNPDRVYRRGVRPNKIGRAPAGRASAGQGMSLHIQMPGLSSDLEEG